MGERTGLVRLGVAVILAMLTIGALLRASGLGADDIGRPAARAGRTDAPEPPRLARQGPPAAGACRLLGERVELPDQVHESSGLALGGDGRVLWTHADAGEPLLLALSVAGEVRGNVTVTGAQVEDWEDLAAGPCEGGTCLFVGDIGDNDADRERITVYRIREPDPGAGRSSPAAALHATYPDGPHDAEALFVDGAGRIHVVTKGETGPIAIYRFPASPADGSISRLERVGVLSESRVERPRRITGASRSPDGSRVALRTLASVTVYPAAALTGASGAEPLAVFDVGVADEAQGEGVALGAGDELFLASEGGKKRDPATLARLQCGA